MFANVLRLGLGALLGLTGYATISAVSAMAARSGPVHVQSDLRPAIAADYSAGQDDLVLQPLLPTILQAIEDDEAWFDAAGDGTLEDTAAGNRGTTPERGPSDLGLEARPTPTTGPARSSTGFDGGSGEPNASSGAETSGAPPWTAPSEATPPAVAVPAQATDAPAPGAAAPEPTASADGAATGGTSTGGTSTGNGGGGGGNSNAGEQGGNRDDGGAGNSGGGGDGADRNGGG